MIHTSHITEKREYVAIGTLPLTTLQKWFLERWSWHNPDQWNIAGLLEIREPLQQEVLRETVRHLCAYHDGLRIRFRQGETGWYAFIAEPDDDVPFSWVDLSSVPKEEQKAAIEATIAQMQTQLSIEKHKFMLIAYFDLGPNAPGRLLSIFHHLIIDAFSLQVVLRDFQTIYQQLSQQQRVQLPPKTTSLREWGAWLATYVASDEMKSEHEEYWMKLPWDRLKPLPVDFPAGRGKDTIGSTRDTEVKLSTQETRALNQCLRQLNTQMIYVLLMALVEACKSWGDIDMLYIDVPEHGRQCADSTINLTRTVGQLALGRRFLLPVNRTQQPRETLDTIKEQIDQVPNRGIGNNLLTFLSKDPKIQAHMQSLPLPEILFNYQGKINIANASSPALLRPAQEHTGSDQDARELRDFTLRFFISILGDELKVTCQYSETLHLATTIDALLQMYMDVLRSIIHTSSNKERGHHL